MVQAKSLIVTIFTRNRNDALVVLLTSLYNQTYDKFDIVIMDDNSIQPVKDDPLIDVFVNHFKNMGRDITIYRSETNNGIAKNRAQLLPVIKKYDYAFDLNDDHLLEPQCIENMITTLNREDVAGVGSATPMFFWSPSKIYKRYKLQPLNTISIKDEQIVLTRDVDYIYLYPNGEIIDKPIEVDHLSQMMYKTKFVKELPTNYSILGFTEETDLSLRVKRNSRLKLMFQPNAINWHMQLKKGGIRDISKRKQEMLDHDWKIFNENWYEFVEVLMWQKQY